MTFLSTPNLNKALAEAKKKIPDVVVSRKAEIQTKSRKISFTYAELEQIQQLIIPVISEFGLSLVHQSLHIDGKTLLRTTLRHESGEEIESIIPLSFDLIAFGSGDYKDLATAISYARRYNFLCLLDVCVVESDDWQVTRQWLGKELSQEVADNLRTNSSPPPNNKYETKKVTEAQLTRLWAIAKQRGLSGDRVKSLIKNVAGVDSGKDIPRNKYDEVIVAIQQSSPTEESQPSINQAQVDRSLLNAEIDSLCKRKGISPDIGKKILSDLWPGVQGRSQLSDKQLLEFRDYISSNPDARTLQEV